MLFTTAALGLVLGIAPGMAPCTRRVVAPQMALLDFINRPGRNFKSSVTLDTRQLGAAPETLVGKTVDKSFSTEFKFDRRGIKTPPKKVLGNTFPAALMPGSKKGPAQLAKRSPGRSATPARKAAPAKKEIRKTPPKKAAAKVAPKKAARKVPAKKASKKAKATPPPAKKSFFGLF